MKTTRNVIDKELISHLLMLESEQQETVLAYIKNLLQENSEDIITSNLIARAKASNQSIKEGRTKSIAQLRKEVKNW